MILLKKEIVFWQEEKNFGDLSIQRLICIPGFISHLSMAASSLDQIFRQRAREKEKNKKCFLVFQI